MALKSTSTSSSAPLSSTKIKNVLVSQAQPESDKNPYSELAKKLKLNIVFKPFIHLEGIPAQEFRKERINIPDYSAVIFTSRNSVDHFFTLCADLRIAVSENMKYFCLNESIAYYLQKYVVYRKRKIFHGKQTIADLIELLKKHKDEKLLVPCSDIHNTEIADVLAKNKFTYSKAVMYRTVCSDISEIKDPNLFDVIVFFSPMGIRSLFQNFPKFKQKNTLVAAFGATTHLAVKEAKLKLDIPAPAPDAPSMIMALEQFITKYNKGK
ncbi:MAG: uroporphyrinogen-III synthase [Bacteroidia bacterium]|nr:uroporphyrinogen-III synthase [Bacteroidia bacterium]